MNERLRALRLRTGLRPGALAAEARVGYQTYYRLERGVQEVSEETIYRIANALSRLLKIEISPEEIRPK